jgi:hypothetical protein
MRGRRLCAEHPGQRDVLFEVVILEDGPGVVGESVGGKPIACRSATRHRDDHLGDHCDHFIAVDGHRLPVHRVPGPVQQAHYRDADDVGRVGAVAGDSLT